MSDYNCTLDITTALDWQRSKADIVQKLVNNQQAWLQKNHCDFWNDWVKDVFTLDTANDFGLSVWSIILDEPLYGYSEAIDGDETFGFASDNENFYNGSFAVETGYSYDLTLEQKRIILKLKAYKVLAMGGGVKDINESLANILGDDVLICLDTLRMSYIYVLKNNDYITIAQILRDRDLLPRPIAVEASVIRSTEGGTIGFADDYENFYNGNFFNGEI